MEKELLINKILPSKNPNFMIAYTNDGLYLIYSHKERVEAFEKNSHDFISPYDMSESALLSFKYFEEKSENCIGKIASIILENETEDTFIGNCLITNRENEDGDNFVGSLYLNKGHSKIKIIKKTASVLFKNGVQDDIQLPDKKEKKRLQLRKEKFHSYGESTSNKLAILFLEQPLFFKNLISSTYNLPFSILNNNTNSFDWKFISLNQNISWDAETISKNIENIDWDTFSKFFNWNNQLIEKFIDQINWKELCRNIKVNWVEIERQFKDNLNWAVLSGNQTYPWTLEKIEQTPNVSWGPISANSKVPFNLNFIKKYKDKINWTSISQNQGDWWNEEIIEEIKDEVYWRNLLVYGKFWNEKLIDRFYDYIDFIELSKNSYMTWDSNILEKYKEKLAFPWLSENQGLQWNNQLIEKYKTEWRWDYIGAVISDTNYVDENIEDFGSSSLWKNPHIIKDEKFCIKHKDILFPKAKGEGWARKIDASSNPNLPVSIDFFYEIKDNLDWDSSSFFDMLLKTGKANDITDSIPLELIKLGIEEKTL